VTDIACPFSSYNSPGLVSHFVIFRVLVPAIFRSETQGVTGSPPPLLEEKQAILAWSF
jgi:hypothetical protein